MLFWFWAQNPVTSESQVDGFGKLEQIGNIRGLQQQAPDSADREQGSENLEGTPCLAKPPYRA